MDRNRKRRSWKGRLTWISLAAILSLIIIVSVYLVAPAREGGNGPKIFPFSVSPQNPVLGSKTAPFTIFEFGDFQCPTCDYWYRTQQQVVVQNLVETGKAKIVWLDFIIYDSDSRLAANAAYAAGEQGKFWEFHDFLYANQGPANSGWVTPHLMTSFAQQLGLNLTEFTQSMNSGKYSFLVDTNIQKGQQLGLQGTPAFFVVSPTGQYVTITGAQPESTFQQAIDNLGGG